MADGNPAETRTVNKIGMERNGVSEEAQSALRQAYKILFREGLTVSNALAKIEKELPPLPEVQHLSNSSAPANAASANNRPVGVQIS